MFLLTPFDLLPLLSRNNRGHSGGGVLLPAFISIRTADTPDTVVLLILSTKRET